MNENEPAASVDRGVAIGVPPTEPPMGSAAPPEPSETGAISEPAHPPVAVAPVKAARSGAVRWVIALLVTAVVIGAASVTLFLVSAGGSVSRLAGWVPSGSYAYAELRLDPPGDQGRRVGDFLAHFPGFADQAQLDAKLTETFDRLLGSATDGKVTYSSMKPWLGDSIAMAATGIPSATVASAPAVLIVSTKDAAKTRQWLTSTVQPAGATTEQYGGAELTVLTADGTPYAYTVLDTVLLAGEKGAVEAAIDTKGASAFSSSEPFKSAVAAIEGDHLGFAYLDTKQLVQAALASTPVAGVVGGALIDRIPAWTTMALGAQSDALAVDVTWPAVTGQPAQVNRTSTLAERLPADTVVAMETRDIGKRVASILDALKADPRTADVAAKLEGALEIAGGTDSVFGWMGDGSIAVAGADGSLSGGLVVTTLDEEAAAAKLAQLSNLLSIAGATSGIGVSEEPYGEGQITVIDLGDLAKLAGDAGVAGQIPSLPAGKLELAYTVQKGLFILGLGDAFVKSVIDTTAGNALADQQRYKTALERAGTSNTGQAYVDIAGLVESSIGLMPAEARSRYEQELKPFVEPLAALAGAGLAGDPMRLRFVVTVK